MLVGNKMHSAFEQCRGYQPSLCGPHRYFVTPELVAARDEMVARRALSRACSKRNVNVLSCSELSPGTEILLYFKDVVKKDVSRWQLGYIADAGNNFATIRRNRDGLGRGLKIALEDIQLMPTSPRLQRLFEIENFDLEESDQLPGRVEIPVTSGSAQAPDFARTEALLAFDAVRTTKRTLLEMDIGVEVQVERRPSASTIDDLSRVEQRLLAGEFDAVGSKEVSFSALSFLPPWVIEKAVETERQNYMNVVEETTYAQAEPHANVLSTHSFLKIKFEDGSDRLKCRLVPHGNRDEEKDTLRKDSSTAQSSVIRLFLAIAMRHKFSVASIDVVVTYLQSGPLPRRVFVRPPRGWAKPGCLWRLLRPAYGLVESGRLWQLTIVKWIFAREFVVVPGAPQVFVLRQSGTLKMLIVKVVDDILACGPPDEIQAFYKDLSRTYKLNPLRTGSRVRFSGMDIVTDNDGSTTIDVDTTLLPAATSRCQPKGESSKTTNAFRTSEQPSGPCAEN
jgi:Reverse transcriptase (RNA-dependent DNA polymerase)